MNLQILCVSYQNQGSQNVHSIQRTQSFNIRLKIYQAFSFGRNLKEKEKKMEDNLKRYKTLERNLKRYNAK